MKTSSEQRFTPLELETRPTVDTAAYAHYMHIAQQTARIHACKETGPIRPIRIRGTAKLHWPVAEIRRVLGVQTGFISLTYLVCLLGASLLLQAVLMAWPDILNVFDLPGIAMLGVIGRDTVSRRYSDLSALAAAAKAMDCMVHLHRDDKGRNVFSVGNSDMGATEFMSYTEAREALQDESLNEADCAERAGSALAEHALDVIRKSVKQSKSVWALENALLELHRLPHPQRAAGGFAVALVAYLEQGVSK